MKKISKTQIEALELFAVTRVQTDLRIGKKGCNYLSEGGAILKSVIMPTARLMHILDARCRQHATV